MAKRATTKIYPEEVFFVVPGKTIPLPVWKQQELARDPSFKDLGEQVKDLETQGSRGVWSSQDSKPFGLNALLRVRTPNQRLEVREEAAVLKANTREAKAQEKKAIEAIQKTRQEPLASTDSCCTIS